MAWCPHCNLDRPIQRHTFEGNCPRCWSAADQDHDFRCRGSAPGSLDVCTFCNNALFRLATDEDSYDQLDSSERVICSRCSNYISLVTAAKNGGLCAPCLKNKNKGCGCGCWSLGLAVFLTLMFMGLLGMIAEDMNNNPGGRAEPSASQKARQNNPSTSRSERTSTKKAGGNEGMAFVMAQSFVKKTLKAPSSASFGSVFSGTFQDPEKATKHLGGNRYRIRAWVESDNSFGANLRRNFTCTVKENEDGTWSCISVSVDD